MALLLFLTVMPPLTNALVSALRITKDNRNSVLAASLPVPDARFHTLLAIPGCPDRYRFSDHGDARQHRLLNETVEPAAPPEQATDICRGSANGDSQDYLLAQVGITWANTNAAPVFGRAMLAPPAAVIASGDAELIVQVFGADGNAEANVPVTINSNPAQTVTTDANGCADFPYLTAGQAYTDRGSNQSRTPATTTSTRASSLRAGRLPSTSQPDWPTR